MKGEGDVTIPLVPHPWDAVAPTMSDINDMLSEIQRHWKEAGELEDEACDLEDEADNKRGLAEEAYARADAVAKQVLDHHPEWHDNLLMDRVDPRIGP
jgi:hypothetical protein